MKEQRRRKNETSETATRKERAVGVADAIMLIVS